MPMLLASRMMAKSTVQFLCSQCGGVQHRWMGKCPDCGAWNTLEEYRVPKADSRDRLRQAAGSVESGAPIHAPVAVPMGEVAEESFARLATGIGELDRVLGGADPWASGARLEPKPGARREADTGDGNPAGVGAGSTSGGGNTSGGGGTSGGGLVRGSTLLVGGDPGIGKSTLLLQAGASLAKRGHRVLYVSSEESAQQTSLRAARLHAVVENLYVLADTRLDRILEQIRKVDPVLVVIDSIQMIYKGEVEAAPGSVAQLRACSLDLVVLAKATGTAVALVGHVTKEGRLAGPRVLEHMVDAVLYFEGDRFHSHRILRAIKNRFGATLEVGLFEMTDRGLTEVRDGSALLAAEYSQIDDRGRARAGSVICPVLQGSRVLLVEMQALTATGFLGAAKRKTSGLDGNRLAMLIAVLEKHGGLKLADQDIFASSSGGLKIVEPAADLALALAIAGAHTRSGLGGAKRGVCAVGELGLGGEVRHVQQMDQRIREVARLGFDRIIGPPGIRSPSRTTTVVSITNISEAMEQLER
ncbi:MAG: DNA repair protein RadA [Phycisphaeraceae bacterium]|nr:DNA repair protein RadA [Phycisphaeraceae bacterium]